MRQVATAMFAALCCALWVAVGTLACHHGWHAAFHAGTHPEPECPADHGTHEAEGSHDGDTAGCAVCAMVLQQVHFTGGMVLQAPLPEELPSLTFPVLRAAGSLAQCPEPPGRAPPVGV
ncbi:MAG: hypothetical protein KIT22_00775 [Verrucomicrobiae bacterium]|nr:hypothetical protein [Verrucomicrobiae bacterium]